MKIYIAMVEDRHTDPEAYPFSTPEAAIEYARTTAHELCLSDEDFEEDDSPALSSGEWLYYAKYSCEGDSVWVVTKELDNPS